MHKQTERAPRHDRTRTHSAKAMTMARKLQRKGKNSVRFLYFVSGEEAR